MRIGVSLLNLRLGVMGGFETFVRKLVDYMPECAGNDEVIFIVNAHNTSFVPSSCLKYELDWSLAKTNSMRIREALFPFLPNPLGKRFRELGIDVMFYPHQAMFPVRNSMPSVVTVADIQHLYYPGYFPWRDRLFRRLSYDRALFRSDQIMAISNFTADCVVENYNVDRDKITVVHHGFEPRSVNSFEPLAGVTQPYIYYPAASFPHKGHLTLFKSFSVLKRAGRLPHKLLLSGVRDDYWSELKQAIEAEGMEQEIIDYGFVSYEEVLGLYAGAEAIVFPTEYEGFGLPVLEAAQFGKKLICSRLAVFDEIGVPSSCQIDFSDPEQLYIRIISNESLPLQLDAISWKQSVSQICELLRGTVSGAGA